MANIKIFSSKSPHHHRNRRKTTIAGSAGIFLCCLLKRLRKYFSAALVTDFSNMFFIHSFHMFGMRSCVPNSLRMLYFATSFHARFCWFVDKVFREFNILKRELCWIWRSESPGKRDRIFAKESCLFCSSYTGRQSMLFIPKDPKPKDRCMLDKTVVLVVAGYTCQSLLPTSERTTRNCSASGRKGNPMIAQ